MTKILILFHQRSMRNSLSERLRFENFATDEASDEGQAMEMCEATDYDAAIVGSDIECSALHLPKIVVADKPALESAVMALRSGAIDYLTMPIDMNMLLDRLRTLAQDESQTVPHRNYRHHPRRTNCATQPIIGKSEAIERVRQLIGRVAPSNARVLVLGENGTGKELVARWIHLKSHRSEAPFVEVNCAAIPAELIESELFGHEKGAFTGAGNAKAGRIEEADGGTLFLDEVGNLTTATQQKLLTVIEKREVARVGSTKARKIDVRIVAATNANLPARVAEGTFREDLLYRLNTIELRIPPLRERGEDILLLARHFLRIYAAKYNSDVREFSHNEEKQLMSYHWPGNVRELQHCIERWVIDSSLPLVPEKRDEAGKSASLNLEELERQTIRRALEQSNGNLSMAAELLGITRYSLYRKIDKHGI